MEKHSGMEQPIFDIIMPCYNSEAYVRNAVDSLLAQTYPHWSLIAVNDGSTDSTPDILNTYAAKDVRIKVYSKENGGYCSAVNYGLEKVSGEYFLMMGSDDRLAPNLFESIIEYAGGGYKKPDMIGFRALTFIDGCFNARDRVTDFDSVAFMENVSVNQYEKAYPDHAKILFQKDTAKCYKYSVLGDLRYFGKYGYDADGIFSTLFAHKARSFMSVPVDGYYITLRRDSVSARTNNVIDFDRMNCWIDYIKYIEKVNQYSEYEFADAETWYVLRPQTIGFKLLRNVEHIRFNDIKEIEKARRLCFRVMRGYGMEPPLPKSRIKRFVLDKLPFVWALWHRMENRNKTGDLD